MHTSLSEDGSPSPALLCAVSARTRHVAWPAGGCRSGSWGDEGAHGVTLLCCGLDGGMTGSSPGDFPMGDTECSRVCSLTSAQPGALWGTLSRAVSRAWGPLQEMTDTKVFQATVCKKDVWGCCRSRFRGRGEGFRHGEKLCSGRGGNARRRIRGRGPRPSSQVLAGL